MEKDVTYRELEIEWPDLNMLVRADLLDEENPVICNKLWDTLPTESIMHHVVISGETMWFPTRIVHLGPNCMVKRAVGDVYFFASGQSIAITYGSVTESAKVNKFAQVRDTDIEKLRRVGQYVLKSTVTGVHLKKVRVIIRGIKG